MSEMTVAHRLYGRLGFTRVPDSDWSPQSGVCLMAFRLRFRRADSSAGAGGRGQKFARCAVVARGRLSQALGRLPWFAPFFLRARRLRPVLPMVSS